MASMYAVYHGPAGLREIAARTHDRARVVAAGLAAAGVEVAHAAFFDTVTAVVPGRAAEVVAAAAAAGINLRHTGADTVGIACDETTTAADVDAVLAAFGASPAGRGADGVPAGLHRDSDF